MPGRTVKLFMVDGTPQGLRTAEIPFGWTGKAIVARRTDLPALALRDEVTRTGVYFLLGPGQSPTNLSVYVGEADVVWKRLTRHTKDEYEDFWEEVVIFVNSSEHLTKAHVRWLEAEIVRRLRSAKRALLKNKTEPDGGPLPEADRSDMEAFIENLQFLMPLLGFDIFRPAPAPVPAQAGSGAETTLMLELKWDIAHARCAVRDGRFVVLKDSTARVTEVDSLGDSYRRLRVELVKLGVLIPSSDQRLYVFNEDYPFEASSAAAAVVSGTGLNGRRHWMIEGTKTSYGQWEDSQLQPVNTAGDE